MVHLKPNASMSVYCTSYCNHGHRLSDGKPVNHECYVLPPSALVAERAGDINKAIELIQAAKPLQHHRGVRRKKEEQYGETLWELYPDRRDFHRAFIYLDPFQAYPIDIRNECMIGRGFVSPVCGFRLRLPNMANLLATALDTHIP